MRSIDNVILAKDDAGYLAWQAVNPLGFVFVNHNLPIGTYTTLNRAELEQWVVTELAAVATPCGLCVQAGRL